MDKLLANKQLLIGLGVVAIVLLTIIILFSMNAGGGGKEKDPRDELRGEEVVILETDNLGKVLEIQALLARQNIEVVRETEGPKSILKLKKYTLNQRDRALIAIVKSGLMDKNIGLEIFDKGDFTSSKEDKRIRLARAINGELARLIKKIPPIEDASVFVSIPEPTIYKKFMKPMTASVQLTLPPDHDRLDKNKIKAITNLLIGSIQNLEPDNVAITDTNGNVYSNLANSAEDLIDLANEHDLYMKSRIMKQLDRLIGKGKYVVTVSTKLREVEESINKILYDVDGSAVRTKQQFTETLGDKESSKKALNGAASVYIPGGPPTGPESDSDRNYSRDATETVYAPGKTEVTNMKKTGIVEQVNIAITMDRDTFPKNMSMEEIKLLVADAAGANANPEHVSIAFSKPELSVLVPGQPQELPQPEDSGNPWWTLATIIGIIFIGGLLFVYFRGLAADTMQSRTIQQLQQVTEAQNAQIRASQQQSAQLFAKQEILEEEVKKPPQIPVKQEELVTTLASIRDKLEESEDDIELAEQLKSWIEVNK